MRRPIAAILLTAAIVASGCGSRATLTAPPAGYRSSLVGFLQSATLDPAPATAPVFALIYTFPKGSSPQAPLDVRPLLNGKLPPWTTGTHALQGGESLAKKGLYVGVFSATTNTIRYLARVGDPREVLGETFDPQGKAVLVRLSGGTYSARVPFIPGAVAVGYEVDVPGSVARVDFYLPFGSTPSIVGVRLYEAVHD